MPSIQPKKRWRKRVTVLVTVLVAYLGVCAYLAHVYVHPPRQTPSMEPKWVKDVLIPSAKGPVPSWATPRLAAGNGRPVVFVLAYGLGGNRGYWSDAMFELQKRGFECVAPSMPGQDASPDDSVGFGVKEAAMVVDTVTWVRQQYKEPPKIVLYGLSMGGAAVWLASEMDPTVDAVVSEGAYGNFEEAMNNWLNRKIPGASVSLKPMVWMACAEAHLNPAAILPVNAAAKWKKPALVVQGAEDKLIPMKQAKALAAAAHCPLWVVPGAAHAECYALARTEFLARLTEMGKALDGSRAPLAHLVRNGRGGRG